MGTTTTTTMTTTTAASSATTAASSPTTAAPATMTVAPTVAPDSGCVDVQGTECSQCMASNNVCYASRNRGVTPSATDGAAPHPCCSKMRRQRYGEKQGLRAFSLPPSLRQGFKGRGRGIEHLDLPSWTS